MVEMPAKRVSESDPEPVAKRGRRGTADGMDTGLLVPTFGLEILRYELNTIHGIAEVNAITNHDDNEEWEASDDVKRGVLDVWQVQEARSKELDYL